MDDLIKRGDDKLLNSGSIETTCVSAEVVQTTNRSSVDTKQSASKHQQVANENNTDSDLVKNNAGAISNNNNAINNTQLHKGSKSDDNSTNKTIKDYEQSENADIYLKLRSSDNQDLSHIQFPANTDKTKVEDHAAIVNYINKRPTPLNHPSNKEEYDDLRKTLSKCFVTRSSTRQANDGKADCNNIVVETGLSKSIPGICQSTPAKLSVRKNLSASDEVDNVLTRCAIMNNKESSPKTILQQNYEQNSKQDNQVSLYLKPSSNIAKSNNNTRQLLPFEEKKQFSSSNIPVAYTSSEVCSATNSSKCGNIYFQRNYNNEIIGRNTRNRPLQLQQSFSASQENDYIKQGQTPQRHNVGNEINQQQSYNSLLQQQLPSCYQLECQYILCQALELHYDCSCLAHAYL